VRLPAIVLSLVCLAIPIQAIAKPTIAVAPLKGDAGNKVAEAIAAALAGDDFAVIGPAQVRREMTKHDLSGELDAKDARKLAIKLGVVAVVDGKLGKSGRKRTARLVVHPRGRPDSGFTVDITSTSSAAFRRGVRAQILTRLDTTAQPETADDDDDDDGRKPAKPADDDEGDRKRSLAADDDRKRTDDEAAARRASRAADDDARRRKPSDADTAAARRKRVASDDEPAVRKRRDRNPRDRDTALQPRAWVGAGASVAQRQLTYDTRSGFTQVPPRVLTTAGAGRIAGEIYPLALTDPSSKLAALGLAAAYDKTFGLSIKLPNQSLQAPINQSHYAIGARYRLGLGDIATVTLGLDYARRHYIADRSGLMTAVLDAPDVDYTAVAPGLAARVPVTPTVAIIGAASGMLMLEAGPIQTTSSYGPASVYGIEASGGVDIALTPQFALRVALEYSLINFSFRGTGALATSRDNDAATQDVNGAHDRSIGVAATLDLVY
jgi:hypothetical protein